MALNNNMWEDVCFPRIGARETKGGADRTQRYRKLEILVPKIFFVDWNDKRNLTHYQNGLPPVFFYIVLYNSEMR